jgi:phosphoenolpyruvate synthase/pyruvate phosphate dikinase
MNPLCFWKAPGPTHVEWHRWERVEVRVIRGEHEFNFLQPGEVLVCPYTNPAWTPLFAAAVAVVAETGGATSHAAIVAREYGIPAVMAVRGATRLLQVGREILVDGNRGRVRRGDN